MNDVTYTSIYDCLWDIHRRPLSRFAGNGEKLLSPLSKCNEELARIVLDWAGYTAVFFTANLDFSIPPSAPTRLFLVSIARQSLRSSISTSR